MIHPDDRYRLAQDYAFDLIERHDPEAGIFGAEVGEAIDRAVERYQLPPDEERRLMDALRELAEAHRHPPVL